MQVIVNNIVIEYEQNNRTLVDKIVKQLEEKTSRILKFFELDHIRNFKIKIWNNLEEFKNFFEQVSNGMKYQNWITAHTDDGNINLLPLEFVKNIPSRANETEDDIAIDVCHEFTHICQQNVNIDASEGWFWEALATNLGNPECYTEILNDYSKNVHFETIKNMQYLVDNFNVIPDAYKYAFLIGKYMLDNIDHNIILEYVKHPKLLHKDREQILISTKEYFK